MARGGEEEEREMKRREGRQGKKETGERRRTNEREERRRREGNGKWEARGKRYQCHFELVGCPFFVCPCDCPMYLIFALQMDNCTKSIPYRQTTTCTPEKNSTRE